MIEDISPAVRNINVPALVLCGENDQVERVETLKQELIPRISDAQIKVVPQSGHCRHTKYQTKSPPGFGISECLCGLKKARYGFGGLAK